MSEWHSRVGGITDSHVHMGESSKEREMLAIREATGIDKMVLVSIQNPETGAGLKISCNC